MRDVGPSHTVECKAASNKICKAILGQADYQMGKTKVFLKVGGEYFELYTLKETCKGKIYNSQLRYI